jgi:hypothetical protein
MINAFSLARGFCRFWFGREARMTSGHSDREPQYSKNISGMHLLVYRVVPPDWIA